MTTYLVLYRSTTSADEQIQHNDAEAGAAAMRAWMDWSARAGEAVVDLGAPTVTVAGGEDGSFIGGYSIMQAESLEALQAIFEGHPHLAGGGTIEFLEMLPLPKM